MENTKDNQELVIRIIEGYIQQSDIERLETALEFEKEVFIPDEVKLKGHLFCGNYFLDNGNYVAALKHYSYIKSLDPTNLEIFTKCLKAFTHFFNDNRIVLSKDDLRKLSLSLSHLYKSFVINFPNEHEVDLQISKLIDNFNIESKYIAEDVEETKLSFRVQLIYDSFIEPKTYQEVLENFADSIEDDLRIFYDEELKKSNKNESTDSKDTEIEDKKSDDNENKE